MRYFSAWVLEPSTSWLLLVKDHAVAAPASAASRIDCRMDVAREGLIVFPGLGAIRVQSAIYDHKRGDGIMSLTGWEARAEVRVHFNLDEIEYRPKTASQESSNWLAVLDDSRHALIISFLLSCESSARAAATAIKGFIKS